MIEISNLCKRYGDLEAVRDLSLSVPRGELFCFLGPNGAGKTTTLKILSGLLSPTSGRTAIDGICMQENPVEAKKLIGYIPDMPFLYERLTSKEFFLFSGDLYSMPRALVETRFSELFTTFDLHGQAATLVKDLSHGMRQRLIYASTFLHDPKVLFIDEPLIGLDPKTIRMIKLLLRAKVQAGMTIFLTTHILALAQDIADRIGIILDGRVVALGTMDELLKANSGMTNLEDVFLKLTGKE